MQCWMVIRNRNRPWRISGQLFGFLTAVLKKTKHPVLVHNHGSLKLDKIKPPVRKPLTLSWNPEVLYGVWNNPNWQFFDSDFFKQPNRSSMFETLKKNWNPGCFENSNNQTTLIYALYFLCPQFCYRLSWLMKESNTWKQLVFVMVQSTRPITKGKGFEL
jgi:hypothetical protein